MSENRSQIEVSNLWKVLGENPERPVLIPKSSVSEPGSLTRLGGAYGSLHVSRDCVVANPDLLPNNESFGILLAAPTNRTVRPQIAMNAGEALAVLVEVVDELRVGAIRFALGCGVVEVMALGDGRDQIALRNRFSELTIIEDCS